MVQQLLPMAGSALGGYFGGPAGAKAGGMAGGMLGDRMAKQGETAPEMPKPDMGDSAMSRRMMAKQSDTFQQLRDGMNALYDLPDDLRKEYARPLLQAYTMEAKKRGIDPYSVG